MIAPPHPDQEQSHGSTPRASPTHPRRPPPGAARADEGCRQRRAQAHDPRVQPALGRQLSRHGPARRPDPAGLLLRHARPRARRRRRRRPGAARPGQGGRHRGEAAAGRAERASGGAAGVADVRGRGGRDARGLRLLRVAQGGPKDRDAVKATVAGERRCASSSARSSARCSRSTPPRASRSRTSPCSARSRSSS